MLSTPRNETINLFKFIMILMVMVIHVFAIPNQQNYGIFLITEGICRIAVPLFFCISGYFLYNTIENNKLNTWLRKIIKIFLFWSLIYLPFQCGIIDYLITRKLDVINFGNTFLDFIFGFYQLWFLPALIIASIIIYAFQKETKKLIISSIILYFSACSVWYLNSIGIISRVGFWSSIYSLRNGLFLGFPMAACGYTLSHYKNSKIFEQLASLKILLLCIALIILESIIDYKAPNRIFFDFTFSSAITSICLLCFAIKRPVLILPRKIPESLSLDIYLFHLIPIIIARYYTEHHVVQYIIVLFSSLAYAITKNKISKAKICKSLHW